VQQIVCVSNLREVGDIIASGNAMLFTGAGFSADAHDLDGKPLPDSEEMRRELWELIFGDDELDASSLQDLYDCGLMKCSDRLHDYVRRRLRVGDAPLPRHFISWFTAPWKRIYTLNVDDLEVAVARQFKLPPINVQHLNGVAGDHANDLTFSTMQYAQRLCGKDRVYEQLVGDFERAPFVFAGTTLDEVTLWQHLELRRRANGSSRTDRPRSFLVSSSLSRARHVLLESLGIEWVQSTIADFADELWARPLQSARACAPSART
jgi:hypothetical protein